MFPLERKGSVADRMVVAGLGVILVLHVVVLATAGPMNNSSARVGGPINYSNLSTALQAMSMLLPAVFAALAALRSRDFARTFWLLTSLGMVMRLVAFLSWHLSPPANFGWDDFIFLLHMMPFGLALLLNDRVRTGRSFNWPMLLDYLQVLLMVVILYVGFIYVPSRGATAEQWQALFGYFATVLVSRNLIVTGGFWLRTRLGNSRESPTFQTMAIYLSIYTVGSVVGHYVFLSGHPASVWLDLEGSVPALAAAWLFWRWRDLPSPLEQRQGPVRSLLGLHLIPSILPIVVAVLATSLATREPRLAWFTVDLSFAIFAVRLLVAIHSGRRTGETLLQTESRFRSLVDVHEQTEAKNLLLKDLALTDALTGLPNRRAIEEWAVPQLSVAAEHHIPFWLVLADLDRFKSVNDAYGHLAGDVVLKKFSEILKANSRRSDMCARIGGEEFVFVLSHATQKDAKLVAERIRAQLEATEFDVGSAHFAVTASFGIAGSEDAPDPDFNRLVAQADGALYSAKRMGRNRVEIAGEEPIGRNSASMSA